MYIFSTTAMDVLKTYGWSAERKVDIEAYKSFYAETGQPTSEIIFNFLASFGGLEIYADATRSTHYDFKIDPFSLELELLTKATHEWIKKPLCCVGTVHVHDMFLMTPEGVSYSVYNSIYIMKMGNGIVDTIENLCNAERGKRFFEEIKK